MTARTLYRHHHRAARLLSREGKSRREADYETHGRLVSFSSLGEATPGGGYRYHVVGRWIPSPSDGVARDGAAWALHSAARARLRRDTQTAREWLGEAREVREQRERCWAHPIYARERSRAHPLYTQSI